jgi:hypothetical protein
MAASIPTPFLVHAPMNRGFDLIRANSCDPRFICPMMTLEGKRNDARARRSRLDRGGRTGKYLIGSSSKHSARSDRERPHQ